MPSKYILALIGLNGLVATGLAAMGSHSFSFADGDEALFQQASEFHFYHTLALLAPALLAKWGQERWAGFCSSFFLLGMTGFSGSLYYRAIMGAGSLGSWHWITPVGGMFLMLGWLCVVAAALQIKPKT